MHCLYSVENGDKPLLKNGVKLDKTPQSCAKLTVAPLKCKQCSQLLDDPELRLFAGDPESAVGGLLLEFMILRTVFTLSEFTCSVLVLRLS